MASAKWAGVWFATRVPVTPSATRLVLPVAALATTGKADAIASSVTLPKVSVVDGLKKMSALASARPRSWAILKTDELAAGKMRLEPFARRTVADNQRRHRDAAPPQFGDGVGEHVQPFFHDQPPQKRYRHIGIGDALRASPCVVAAIGMEDAAIDAARPDRDIVVHTLIAQDIDHALRWRHQRVAPAIQFADPAFQNRPQKSHIVECGICFEPRVHRCDHRQAAILRPTHGGARAEIRAGDMQDVGREGRQIAAYRIVQPHRHAVFAAARNGEGRHADQIALRREGGLRHRRRIDPHCRTPGAADNSTSRFCALFAPSSVML